MKSLSQNSWNTLLANWSEQSSCGRRRQTHQLTLPRRSLNLPRRKAHLRVSQNDRREMRVSGLRWGMRVPIRGAREQISVLTASAWSLTDHSQPRYSTLWRSNSDGSSKDGARREGRKSTLCGKRKTKKRLRGLTKMHNIAGIGTDFVAGDNCYMIARLTIKLSRTDQFRRFFAHSRNQVSTSERLVG